MHTEAIHRYHVSLLRVTSGIWLLPQGVFAKGREWLIKTPCVNGEKELRKIPDTWMKGCSERTPCRGWKVMLLCTKWLKSSLPSRDVGNSLFSKPKIVFLCHQRPSPLHISDQALLGYCLPFKTEFLKQLFDAPVAVFHSSLLPAILH